MVGWVVLTRGGWHDHPLPSLGWTTVAVGVAGYGSTLLHAPARTQALIAIVTTPLLLIPVAYLPNGEVRPWPWSRRSSKLALAAALLLAATYAVMHPFTVDGVGAGTYPRGSTEVDVSVYGALLPSEIQAVTVDRGCAPGTVYTFKSVSIQYTMLGITTTQSLPLQPAVRLRCPG